MSVIKGLIKADEFDDNIQDQTIALVHLEQIYETLERARDILKRLDIEVQDAFNDSVYTYDGKGLRVRMGYDALKASGIEKAIPAVAKQIKDLEARLK